jgi:hypothetical protein
VGTDHIDPDDDHWGLARPEHVPSHDRFFDEGEEPPERYDLPDAADYVRANPDPMASWRWRRLAWNLQYSGATWYSISYYLLSVVTLCLGCLPAYAFVAPAAYGDLVVQSMWLLTENSHRYGKRRAWRSSLTLAIASAPTLLSQIVTIIGVFGLGTLVAPTVSHLNAELTYVGGAGPGQPLPEDWPLIPAYLLAAVVLIVLHTFVCVRVGGFVTHLILDHDLGPLQAIRANWRITERRLAQLMWLKIRLWFWQALMLATIYGGWLVVFYEPYACAVWTAAYLDIAGSEPPREAT